MHPKRRFQPEADRPEQGRPEQGRPDQGRPDAHRPNAYRPNAYRPQQGELSCDVRVTFIPDGSEQVYGKRDPPRQERSQGNPQHQ